MNARRSDTALGSLLRDALPAMGDTAETADLWPRLRPRLEPARPRLGWFDWILVLLAAGLMVRFPQVLLLVLYHV